LTNLVGSGFTRVGGGACSPSGSEPKVAAIMLKTPRDGRDYMKLPQAGGCQCGKVRYEITQPPQLVYACHCRDCQRLTSSAFSMGIVVTESGFHLAGIEPRSLQRLADSGRTSTRWVCPECGSWIAGPPRDGLVRVRAGTLDDTSWLRPTRHIWTRSKQPWVTFAEGDEIFEAQPPA
jgi:hypothetical protein